jgi:hypothetical protein
MPKGFVYFDILMVLFHIVSLFFSLILRTVSFDPFPLNYSLCLRVCLQWLIWTHSLSQVLARLFVRAYKNLWSKDTRHDMDTETPTPIII